MAALLGIVFIGLVTWTASEPRNYNPKTYLTVPEVLAHYGYPSESHKVLTADGYILTIHRITGGKNSSAQHLKAKRVVYLQHGVIASDAEWFYNSERNLLPLALADEGYEIWLGNSRGNFYSRAHSNLSIEDRRFWEFSFDEMGRYDLPAVIDHILEVTGVEKIYYVGFSLGTTTFWVMMNYHPEYNEKVHFFLGLAPVVYLNQGVGLPHRIGRFLGRFPWALPIIEILFRGEFFPPRIAGLMKTLFPVVCSEGSLAVTLCTIFTSSVVGFNPGRQNDNSFPFLVHNAPSPTSIRTIRHLIQYSKTGKFNGFDFGEAGNLKRYSEREPPLYDLRKTTVPTALIYETNNWVVHPEGVKRLTSELGSLESCDPVNQTGFAHLDYFISSDAYELVVLPVLERLAAH